MSNIINGIKTAGQIRRQNTRDRIFKHLSCWAVGFFVITAIHFAAPDVQANELKPGVTNEGCYDFKNIQQLEDLVNTDLTSNFTKVEKEFGKVEYIKINSDEGEQSVYTKNEYNLYESNLKYKIMMSACL